MRQKDQHVIVTGAGTGIGRAIALRMASEGARLSLLARRMEPLQLVCSEIEKKGGTAQAFCCDIRDKAQVEQQFGKAIVSTSANISKSQAPTQFSDISNEIISNIDYIVNLRKKDIRNKPSRIIKIEKNGRITKIR